MATTRFSTEPSSPTSTASALLGLEPHEFDLLQPDVVLGRQHDAGAAGQIGEQARRLRQRALEAAFVRGGADLIVDPRALLAREAAEFEQRVDIEAQAELGRQPPRAGVRGVDQPEFLEILHDVADRGRRQRNRQQAREHARADRLAAGEIGIDDAAEDFARARVERGERARFGGSVERRGHDCTLAGRGDGRKTGSRQAIGAKKRYRGNPALNRRRYAKGSRSARLAARASGSEASSGRGRRDLRDGRSVHRSLFLAADSGRNRIVRLAYSLGLLRGTSSGGAVPPQTTDEIRRRCLRAAPALSTRTTPRRGARGARRGHRQTFEMWFDREAGEERARIVDGPFRGRKIEALSRTECFRLHEYCRFHDPVAAQWLERLHPPPVHGRGPGQAQGERDVAMGISTTRTPHRRPRMGQCRARSFAGARARHEPAPRRSSRRIGR